MAHAYYHAKSSARKHGGTWEDYLELHAWMDHTKGYLPDNRHRMLLHNAWGIFLGEQIFGPIWTCKSNSRQVPTRTILEQHVLEDLKYIPTLEQAFANVPLEDWLSRNALPLSRQEEKDAHVHVTIEPTSTDPRTTRAAH